MTSPVLLLGVVGLWLIARRGRLAEAVLLAAIFLAYLLLNASFNNWGGGGTFGPRYLIPALPFLCLPLAAAFHALPRIGLVLRALSIAIMLLFTAVDPEMSAPARDPLFEYALPVFTSGAKFDSRSSPPRAYVSVNPLGVYEATAFSVFPAESRQVRMNSFSVGEIIWPESRMSLLPLLVLFAAGAWGVRLAIKNGARRAS